MKIEILQRLVAAQNMLDAISVPHKENWRAMFTVATLIEEASRMLNDWEVPSSSPTQETAE